MELRTITVFVSGDVMTGRGIDQIMPHPSDPIIYEPYVKDARDYVRLAEERNGTIPKPVDFAYIWGDALEQMARMRPDVRIINLETSVTTSNEFWPGKGIHYRMHPHNIPCITMADIDCCVLANNHVLDWGYPGLEETLQILSAAGLRTAGAGRYLAEAEEPSIAPVPGKGRVLVFGFGLESSGIHSRMAAHADRPGVNLLADLTDRTVRLISAQVGRLKRGDDIVIASIHWGSNWGYDIPAAQVRFAHGLIDAGGVDIVHGHSSHHVKGVEVYQGKLILYGCGDLLTDYEGIAGYDEYRGDLGLMYFVTVAPANGNLVRLEMLPTQVHRFRLRRATGQDRKWLRGVLTREGRWFNTGVGVSENDSLLLHWT